MHDLSRRALLVSLVAASGARLLRLRPPRPTRRRLRLGRRRRSATQTSSSGRATLPPRRSTARFPLCPTAWRTSISTPGATSASNPISRCSARKGPISASNCFISGISTSARWSSTCCATASRRRSPTPPISSTTAGPRSTTPCRSISASPAFGCAFRSTRPHVWDEVIAFLGASYFRFLGRGQRYGLSARGLAINATPSLKEEFPFFREFWIETPDADGRARRHLCAARQRIGDRRLPLRPHSGPGKRDRRERLPVRAQGDAGARTCAAVFDVFRRQGRSALPRRLPRRIA